MTDKEFFDALVEQGLLGSNIAESVLRDAKMSHSSPEDVLYSKRLIDEEVVAKVKSKIMGVPYAPVDVSSIPEDVLRLVPEETSRNYRVIPISKNKSLLTVGMLRPDDEKANEALRFLAKRDRMDVGAYLVTPSVLEKVWRRYTPFAGEIDQAVRAVGPLSSDEEDTVSLEETLQKSEEGPIIKIVASALRHSVEMSASDVHIEPQPSRVRIRFRIDGVLHEMASLPNSLTRSIIARVKVLAQLQLDETRIPQDGRFRTVIHGRDIDFRVATFPTPSGEKVVVRVLDSGSELKNFDTLGVSEYNRAILEKALTRPYGMILVTGPTGSGKSTTMNTIVRRLNTEEVNIVSLEDPVEYFVEGVNQSQVRPEIGYTFASGLRQILRQDPDIIMVGEIRDGETAGLAVNAALTGHIMLSTLHTNNSVGVVPRLRDLGVHSFLLSPALHIIIAQRLIRLVCLECSSDGKASDSIQKIISDELSSLPEPLIDSIRSRFSSPYSVRGISENKNCEACKGKGVKGRIAIHEVFRMTHELGEIINSDFTEKDLLGEAKRQGIVTMRQDGIIKALEGKILIEHVLKETAD
jgi:type IV pilus assembly protein PilB